MLFPQRDESRPLSRFPIAIVLIVAANVVVFLIELALGESFILRYAMKPAEVARGEHLETLFTSMFMHANFFHIFGNMLYLWVFGDELEANYLGPVRFGLFYLVCGLAAGILQMAVDPSSIVPNLGASGAIAGVLGAFLARAHHGPPVDRLLVCQPVDQRRGQHHLRHAGGRRVLRPYRGVRRRPRARQALWRGKTPGGRARLSPTRRLRRLALSTRVITSLRVRSAAPGGGSRRGGRPPRP